MVRKEHSVRGEEVGEGQSQTCDERADERMRGTLAGVTEGGHTLPTFVSICIVGARCFGIVLVESQAWMPSSASSVCLPAPDPAAQFLGRSFGSRYVGCGIVFEVPSACSDALTSSLSVSFSSRGGVDLPDASIEGCSWTSASGAKRDRPPPPPSLPSPPSCRASFPGERAKLLRSGYLERLPSLHPTARQPWSITSGVRRSLRTYYAGLGGPSPCSPSITVLAQ